MPKNPIDINRLSKLPEELVLEIAKNFSIKDISTLKIALAKTSPHVSLDSLYEKFVERLQKMESDIKIDRQKSFFSQYTYHFKRITNQQYSELDQLSGLYINYYSYPTSPTLETLEKFHEKLNEINLAKIKSRINLNSTELNLEDLDLTRIPENFISLASIEYWQRLEQLLCNHNNLIKLPSSITQISNLKILRVQQNALQSLPDNVDLLLSLERINLSTNQIRKLPDNLFKLTNLVALDISDNRISELSDQIQNLKKLEILVLSSNQLKTLPNSITNLTRLNKLYLGNNNISNLPQGVMDFIYNKKLMPSTFFKFESPNWWKKLKDKILQFITRIKKLFIPNPLPNINKVNQSAEENLQNMTQNEQSIKEDLPNIDVTTKTYTPLQPSNIPEEYKRKLQDNYDKASKEAKEKEEAKTISKNPKKP